MAAGPRTSTIPPAEITELQWEQASIVQAEVLELMRRLIGDGFDYRIVMTGTSCAIADLVASMVGSQEVPLHFAKLAAMTYHMAGR
jgi:hypothetical protein